MKNLLVILIALLAFTLNAEIKYETKGNIITQVKTSRSKGEPIKTKYQFQDSKGKFYDVYISPSGSCFYYTGKTTKTGTPEKHYLGKEKSSEIAKEYRIEYKPRSSK